MLNPMFNAYLWGFEGNWLASKWNSKLTIMDLLALIIIHPTKSPLDLVMVGRMRCVSMGTTQVQQTQDPTTPRTPT